MRKVLLIAYAFPPINSPAALRVAGFARHLPQYGWSPVVLAPDNGLGRGYDLPEPPGVEIWRVPDPDPVKAWLRRRQGGASRSSPSSSSGPGWPGWPGRLLRGLYETLLFPDRDILWGAAAARAALTRLGRRPDIAALVSSASGASKHWAAAWLQRRTRLPWVAVFHDPWAGDTRTERPRPAVRAWLERRLEASLCRQANQVVTVSAGCVPRLCCDPARVSLIRGGFEPTDFHDLPRPPRRPFRIAHAGTLYGGQRDPSGLFRAVRQLLDRSIFTPDAVEILFIGTPDPAVASLAARSGVDHVLRWTGALPHRQSLEWLAASHVLAVISTAAGYELPTKFFEYLAVGRPILALWDPAAELGQLVQATGAGAAYPPDDTLGIAGFLAGQQQAWRAGVTRLAPDPALTSAFTRQAGAARLAEILTAVASNPVAARTSPARFS